VPDIPILESSFPQLAPEQLRAALTGFLPKNATTAEKTAAVEAGLSSPIGQGLRAAIARWIVDEILPVDRLVPPTYLKWRPPVRHSMQFVIARLSPARLAPKIVEQLEISEKLSVEERLFRLIARVPGLQKLGQVIARNRHLRPALRTALARLENGIRDVEPDKIRRIIQEQLRTRLERYQVEIAPTILSEASVSAVLRFRWRNPASGRRERGVFKVLKPHIPDYFAEDMDYLHGLAQYFGERHHRYGFPAHLIPDTFRKVRRLLRHEVNFVREQKTLLDAAALYRDIPGVRVPRLIQPLCTPMVTALSEEPGIKVTNAAARFSKLGRTKIAERLIGALVAVPLLASEEDAIFHGDPHAGNLLYDARTDTLTIIDWALRERLSREQRRHLALLLLMVSLRDPVGAANEVMALSQQRIRSGSGRAQTIQDAVAGFMDHLPLKYLPCAADAMRLLEKMAMKGIKFPGSLVMLSKVMFTLDGILSDVDGDGSGMSMTIARHLARRWVFDRKGIRLPLTIQDWITLQCSALLYAPRVWLKYEQTLLERYLSAPSTAVAEV
jgi:ubiquinone biosynthesis protein